MNNRAMAAMFCLALHPVIALGVETMIRPEVRDHDSKRSFEIQRSRQTQGDVAKSCIPMGGARNDCEPMTRSRPDAARLVHTFSDGTKLYEDPGKSGVHKYSAIDQRGRALKVQIVQNSQRGMVPVPGDATERGKQRADRERERRRAKVDDAITEGLERTSAGKCVVKVMSISGGFTFWDMSSSGGGCP